LQDDDLIFDPEGKQTAAQAPLIETHQDDSLFHRIKRGVWDLFTSLSTTTTTTQAPSGINFLLIERNRIIILSCITILYFLLLEVSKTLTLFFLSYVIIQFFNCPILYSIVQKKENEVENQDIDKSIILNGDEGNHTLDQPEVPGAETSIGGIERLTLEKNEDNDEADDDEVYIHRFENVLSFDFFIY